MTTQAFGFSNKERDNQDFIELMDNRKKIVFDFCF